MTTPPDPWSAEPGGTPPQPQPGYAPPPTWDAGTGPAAGYGQAPGYGPPPVPGYGPPPAWGPPAHGGPAQTDTRAIIALVLAIASFFTIPVIPAIVALVLASGAKRDIEASGGRLTGEGLVTAAKVTAWVNIGLTIAALVLFVGVLGLFFVA